MTLINNRLIYLIFFIFLLSSCNKDDDSSLPTGENTAYFYVDGKLVIPQGDSEDPAIFFWQNNNSFEIVLYNKDIPSYLEIELNDELNLNMFYLNDLSENYCYYSVKDVNSNWHVYENDDNDNSGNLTITSLSEDEKKFKGTFEMDVYDNNGEVKHITNGHININLETLDN